MWLSRISRISQWRVPALAGLEDAGTWGQALAPDPDGEIREIWKCIARDVVVATNFHTTAS